MQSHSQALWAVQATARETTGNDGAYAAAPQPDVEMPDQIAQGHPAYNSPDSGHPQHTRQGQAVPVQQDRGQGNMQSIPEQHTQVMPSTQQAATVQYITTGAEHHMHQGGPAGPAPTTGAHGSRHYSTFAQPQYHTVAPPHVQTDVAQQPRQQYATGNYTYVTTSAAPTGASPAAQAEQAPGQNQMYVLVTGQDGGQYLLPVMEAQVA